MVIVSHKTKTPFNGPPYDLRKAALDWLDKYGFFSQEVIGWNSNQVFFENTKSLKAERICSLGCTHYVDDLPEILSILPDTIARILYDPNRVHNVRQYKSFSEWSSLSALITPDS